MMITPEVYIKENFVEEVLNSDIPVLVDFWATWCGPCMMLAPTLERFAEKYEGKVKVCKINVDSDLRLGFVAATRRELALNPEKFNPRDFLSKARTAMTQICVDEIRNIMGSENMINQ